MQDIRYDLFSVDKREELLSYVNDYFDSFINSPALQEILRILDTDIDNLDSDYNARRRNDGTIIESTLMSKNNKLEERRRELFPLFQEMDFYNKNKTDLEDYTRVIVFGGTLRACNTRTIYAEEFVNSTTKSIDGLSCYRPIAPTERKNTEYHSDCDSEFGALSEAFVNFFDLNKSDYDDDFTSNRNINSISCIRTFHETYKGAVPRVYASPSLEPDIRRADTGDCLLDYINNNTFDNKDKLLFISHNKYCKRQFIQVLYYLLKTEYLLPYDIIGCVSDDNLPNEDTYNLTQDIQELIAIIDWIVRFRKEYIEAD